ncbi:hypothetical protein H3147_02700, partial [Streptomyces sp. OF8]|nr:hypothetical protein [Streptomyces alkaliterrae]
APTMPAPTARDGERPRGARFAGAYEADEPRRPAAPPPEALRAAARAAAQLTALRAAQDGGGAYVLLCEATGWPSAWLPPLAAELERSGLAADVSLLLWELATLPPPALAEAAVALDAAGRAGDCSALLRQASARRRPEVAEVALALCHNGRRDLATVLLTALLRARTIQEAAEVVEPDRHTLTGLLLDAAEAVSVQQRHAVARMLEAAD